MLDRYPHQFSGGQAQRIGIARALIANPSVLVCDEPVSALDVSIRAQVLDLLADERAKRNVALLFIAHDLSAVRFLCERTLVLYRGQVMEQGPTAALFAAPRHPYTQLLLGAALVADPRRARRRPRGAVSPSAAAGSAVPPASALAGVGAPVASGCAFAPRCPRADVLCADTRPRPRVIDGVTVACHHAG
jgi:oligopeptide/dipeptide ABC transporter ATP-binding protein